MAFRIVASLEPFACASLCVCESESCLLLPRCLTWLLTSSSSVSRLWLRKPTFTMACQKAWRGLWNHGWLSR